MRHTRYVLVTHTCAGCGWKQELRVPEHVEVGKYAPRICGRCEGTVWTERKAAAA